jgi:glutamate-1-semialdehyde aminotransferase
MSTQITNFEKSRAYRAKIHDLIPGGAHTYSKGDDQFPELSPAAITHGKGAYVWDLDGNRYLDCSMGLTSVSLGHAYQPVLDRVIDELGRGANFQRPSVLEGETAERFLTLVPGHDMIKFAKNGSTVTTAAVKLARAKTGRTLVAFPGNHPFYSYDDWFIGRTASNKGVPDEVTALSVTFTACDIDSLKALFAKYPGQIACVITEPEKSTCGASCPCGGNPAAFIKAAIELAHADGALFIVDEMITGFKSGWPGSFVAWGLTPDMATWGKGIANGFAFCALTGTKEVMELGGIRAIGEEKVFLISTTHGAETHAMAAAIASIDTFEQHDVIAHNQGLGRQVITRSRKAIAAAGLSQVIDVSPCEWMVTFLFRNAAGTMCSGMRTLMLQEMIARGILFQGIVVPCLSHTDADVDVFIEALTGALPVYARALTDGYQAHLVGEPAKPVFRKLL